MQAWARVRGELVVAHTAAMKSLSHYSRNPPNDRTSVNKQQGLMAGLPTIAQFFGSAGWSSVRPPAVVAAARERLVARRAERKRQEEERSKCARGARGVARGKALARERKTKRKKKLPRRQSSRRATQLAAAGANS